MANWRTTVRMAVLGVLLTVNAPVGAKKEPEIQTGPDAEVTADGLHRVDRSRFKYVWAKPDIDLSGYTKILPVRLNFHYRVVRDRGNPHGLRSGSSEFPIEQKNREKFESTVHEVFKDEMGKLEHWEITDTPGPDTLIVIGGLHDVVSRVPPEYAGRSEIYLSSVGEATLILQMEDSMTREVLARATDRRSAEPVGGSGLIRSNSVTTLTEVRRVARRWAKTLRTGLDSFKQ